MRMTICIPEIALCKAFHEGIVYEMIRQAFLGNCQQDIIVVVRYCLRISGRVT